MSRPKLKNSNSEIVKFDVSCDSKKFVKKLGKLFKS